MSPTFSLSDVLFVPNLDKNLLSLSQLSISLNCSITMFPSYCLMQDLQTGKVIGRGRERDGLYYLDTASLDLPSALVSTVPNKTDVDWKLWHARLGHPHDKKLELMSRAQC